MLGDFSPVRPEMVGCAMKYGTAPLRPRHDLQNAALVQVRWLQPIPVAGARPESPGAPPPAAARGYIGAVPCRTVIAPVPCRGGNGPRSRGRR